MRMKKRRKSSRFRGSQTARRGKKARTRGSGNQGGKGWAGTGKRADQKKSLVIKMTGGNNYFGKDKTLRKPTAKKLRVINLADIQLILDSLIARGIAVNKNNAYEINLKGYKILGEGDIILKVKITASAASSSAIEKVKSAGGEIILEGDQSQEKKKIE